MRRLSGQEFIVEVCSDVATAAERLSLQRFELVLLDWSLSGLELLLAMRQRSDPAAVVMVVPKGAASPGVRALNGGADDFVWRSAPFDEVLARMRAVLRRTSSRANPRLELCELTLDPVRRKVSREGKDIRLSTREFSLLQFLMNHAGEPQSRSAIVESVWESGQRAASNVVDVYIRHLRHKVDVPFGKSLIHTVRGHGYVLGEPS